MAYVVALGVSYLGVQAMLTSDTCLLLYGRIMLEWFHCIVSETCRPVGKWLHSWYQTAIGPRRRRLGTTCTISWLRAHVATLVICLINILLQWSFWIANFHISSLGFGIIRWSVWGPEGYLSSARLHYEQWPTSLQIQESFQIYIKCCKGRRSFASLTEIRFHGSEDASLWIEDIVQGPYKQRQWSN